MIFQFSTLVNNLEIEPTYVWYVKNLHFSRIMYKGLDLYISDAQKVIGDRNVAVKTNRPVLQL